MADQLLPPVASLDTLFSGGKPSAPAPSAPAPTVGSKWAPYLSIAAEREQAYGLPPGLVQAVIVNGEHWGRDPNPGGVSPKGARGISQFMPATAQQYGVNPDDPASSIDGTARYLRDLLKQFNGDARLAAAAYNAGPGNVQKYGGVPPFPETQSYVQRVTASPFLRGGSSAPAAPAPQANAALTPAIAGAGEYALAGRQTFAGGPDIINLKRVSAGPAIPTGGAMIPVGFDYTPPAAPEKPASSVTSFLGDMGNELMLGFASLGRAGTFIARSLTDNQVTQWLDETAKNAQDYWTQRLTPRQQTADQAEWISSQPDEIFGEAWADPRAYAGLIVRNLPSLLPGLGAAKGASIYGAASGATAARAALAKGATAEVAEQIGKQAAVRAATRMGAIAGAITEGTIGGGQTGADTYDVIMRLPEETLQQSEIYSRLRQTMDPQAARNELARNQGLQALLIAGVTDAALGGVGDAILARTFLGKNAGRIRGALNVGAQEATTEALQSGGEQLAQNYGVQGADPSQDLWQGVPNAMAGGAIGGAGVGGGVGFIAPHTPHDLLQTPPAAKPAVPAIEGAPLPKLPGAAPGVPTYQFGSNTPIDPNAPQGPASAYPRRLALPAPPAPPAPVMTVNPQGEASFGPMGPSSPVGAGPLMGNEFGEVGRYGQVPPTGPYSPVGPSSPYPRPGPRQIPVQGGQGPVIVPLQTTDILQEPLQNRPFDTPGMRDLRAGLRGGMGFSWGDVDAAQAAERAQQEEEAYRQRELQLAEAPAAGTPGEPTYTRGELLRTLQSVTRTMGKEAPTTKTGEPRRQWLSQILQAASPVAAIREVYASGTHPQAELLDRWHQELTGRPIETPAPTADTAPTAVEATTTAASPSLTPGGPTSIPTGTSAIAGPTATPATTLGSGSPSPSAQPMVQAPSTEPAPQPRPSSPATGTSSGRRKKAAKPLEKIQVKVAAVEAESGEEVTVRMPANEALQDVDNRLMKAYQLLECLLS